MELFLLAGAGLVAFFTIRRSSATAVAPPLPPALQTTGPNAPGSMSVLKPPARGIDFTSASDTGTGYLATTATGGALSGALGGLGLAATLGPIGAGIAGAAIAATAIF